MFFALLVVYLAGLAEAGLGLGLTYIQSHESLRAVTVAVVSAAAVIGLVVLHYLLRTAIQARSAAQPGGIDIAVFPASPLRDESTNEIAAELRHALADVYLSGPSVVPGESKPQDFLTDVRSVAENARTPWGALLAGLSLLSPHNVYRVTCAASVDADSGTHGLTVEVSGYPRQDVSVTTISGEAWPQITRRAACHIAAYVLPRTKLSRIAPWKPWRGIRLDPDLFFHFDEARRLARAGRLEEALHHFNEATALDPLNPYIRIERATVQDELGLWIDALGSYVDVVTLESWYHRRVWKRYGRVFHDRRSGAPGRLTRSPHGAAALQVARFRMIGSLASGQRLALQWRRNTSGSDAERVPQHARNSEARRVIRRLRPLLIPYAELMMDAHGVPRKSKGRTELRDRLRENDLEILRRVFQFAALDEAAALRRDYGSYWHRAKAELPIKRASIRVIPILTLINYHYVERAQQDVPGLPLPHQCIRRPWMRRGGLRLIGRESKYSIRWLMRADAAIGWQPRRSCGPGREWPPRPDGLSREIKTALGQRFPRSLLLPRKGWHEHYNAGCVFALGMITPSLPPVRPGANDLFERHERLVRLAVDEFARAVVAADSQFASRKSVWLGRGDQDLDDLRSTPEYITFVERYLPNTGPARTLPANPTPLVVSGHIARIIGEYAALRKRFWQERDPQILINVADIGAEAECWELLHEVCKEYRDWRTRLRLIRHIMVTEGPRGQFNPGISPHDPWLGWEPGSLPTQTLPRGAARSYSENRVNEWLNLSRRLNAQAARVVQQRGQRLVDLTTALEHLPLNKYITVNAAYASYPLTNLIADRLTNQLADTWGMIDAWVRGKPGVAGIDLEKQLNVVRKLMVEVNGS